jgi:DNA excision repair protein ERCC-1
MDDDDFGADADFLAALAASDAATSRPAPRIQQPIPQRLDRPPPKASTATGTAPKPVQPTPQALSLPGSSSSILVSPRQKANPLLTHLLTQRWEYTDSVADYVLSPTTCALFLSLKYHRLHPDYIYTRIRKLGRSFGLRILLIQVDVDAHEEPLRELNKTGLVNGLTLVCAWSSREAARWLELYKAFSPSTATGDPSASRAIDQIRKPQPRSYTERIVEFGTVPRGVNKTDAVALISARGSVRAAVNVSAEELVALQGWGERKSKAWLDAVNRGFRREGAKRRQRALEREDTDMPLSRVPLRSMESVSQGLGDREVEGTNDRTIEADALDDEEAERVMIELERGVAEEVAGPSQSVDDGDGKQKETEKDKLTDGVAAALARLRNS